MRERNVKSCVFCHRIKEGDFDFEDLYTVSFEPLNPVVEGHRLFIPKDHVPNAGISPTATAHVAYAAASFAYTQGEEYNLITSAGPFATQTVFHLHTHYIPRRFNDGLALPWTGQTT
jgi:histidine triad (HIT) family protein